MKNIKNFLYLLIISLLLSCSDTNKINYWWNFIWEWSKIYHQTWDCSWNFNFVIGCYKLELKKVDYKSFSYIWGNYWKDINSCFYTNKGFQCDWDSIQSFSWSQKYLFDKKYIYYKWEKIINADIDTFKIDFSKLNDNYYNNEDYSKDKDNVYYRWIKINWVDNKSFQVIQRQDDNREIDTGYSKDNNNVYYKWFNIWADSKSFKEYPITILKDWDYYSNFYFIDKENLYLFWKKINLDTNTLSFISSLLFKDKDSLYCAENIVDSGVKVLKFDWLDISNFSIISDNFINDNKNIYFYNCNFAWMFINKLDWIDAKTFSVTTWFKVKDKYNNYDFSKLYYTLQKDSNYKFNINEFKK